MVSKIDHTFTFIMDSTKFLQSKQTCTFRRGCRFTSQATLSQAVQRKLLFCFSGKLELIISSSTFFTLNWSTILCTLDLGELRRTSLSTSRSPSQSECLESLESVKLFKARKTIEESPLTCSDSKSTRLSELRGQIFTSKLCNGECSSFWRASWPN